MNTTTRTADQEEVAPTYVVASTPEGIVEVGDLHAMQRYILLHQSASADPAQALAEADNAKSWLFQAATSNLVQTIDGRIMRIRVYGWPVSIAFKSECMPPTEFLLAGASDNRVLLKMKELWARAFKARQDTLISPLRYATHLNALLGITPVQVRDCLRHGVRLFSGQANKRPWQFAQEGSLERSGPDLPAAYVFTAYVAWELGDPEPEVVMDMQLQSEMESLVAGLFTQSPNARVKSLAGGPQVFDEAITSAQCLMFRQLCSRCFGTRRTLSLSNRVDGQMHSLSALLEDGENEQELRWNYSALWRPMSHVVDISEAVMAEVQRHSTNANGSSGGVFPMARQSPFRAIH